MTVTLTVDVAETDATAEIPLNIKVTSDAGSVDQIVVKGLPKSAKLSAGARQANDTWVISATDIAGIKVTFDRIPSRPVKLEFEAIGTSPNGPISGLATATVAIKATANSTGTIVTAILLVMLSGAVFTCWRMLYQSAQDVLSCDWSVPWEQPKDVLLKAGPITFWYDPVNRRLHHRGPIDAKLKLQILGLAYAADPTDEKKGVAVTDDGATPSQADPRIASYIGAVDRLAYESNGLTARYFVYLLSLAGLSGMLGTLIRAFANFIYVSTVRNDLNVRVWWPWYALRPVLGFLLALMAVLLVEGKLFVPATDAPPSGTAWWMALAMLVGFAADDFAQRLRLVGQALFGKEK